MFLSALCNLALFPPVGRKGGGLVGGLGQSCKPVFVHNSLWWCISTSGFPPGQDVFTYLIQVHLFIHHTRSYQGRPLAQLAQYFIHEPAAVDPDITIWLLPWKAKLIQPNWPPTPPHLLVWKNRAAQNSPPNRKSSRVTQKPSIAPA